MITNNMEINLTKKEELAISAIKRVAKRWPKTLWLLSASETLTIMRYGKDGNPVMTTKGGFDQDYMVGTVNIENDGGDW